MDSAIPAVVVARRDGTLVSQNGPARHLMGAGEGKPCWEVVGGLEAEGLPCQTNCVGRLLDAGLERTQLVDLKLAGREHRLTCVPVVDDLVVCVLNCGAVHDPDKFQTLTNREQDVLSLLAAGDETPAVAKKLEVSESTIRTHVENMRAKHGVKTRAALVALGFRFGYLS
jgi:DNA-binding CsgD family transcriptional regulator